MISSIQTIDGSVHPDPADADRWIRTAYSPPEPVPDGPGTQPVPGACDIPHPVNADVSVILLGDPEKGVTLQADTEKEAAFLEDLNLETGQVPPARTARHWLPGSGRMTWRVTTEDLSLRTCQPGIFACGEVTDPR